MVVLVEIGPIPIFQGQVLVELIILILIVQFQKIGIILVGGKFGIDGLEGFKHPVHQINITVVGQDRIFRYGSIRNVETGIVYPGCGGEKIFVVVPRIDLFGLKHPVRKYRQKTLHVIHADFSTGCVYFQT